ncbi:MAG: ABC transporter substrate-binding protein [Desulfotignum sp.]
MHHLIARPILVTIFVLFFAVGNVEASPARDQLKATIDSIIKILEDDTFKGETNAARRRAALKEVIFARFDFEKMSQLSLARHWRDRTSAERETFVQLFSRLLEETYVAKIEAYNDEKVRYVKEQVRNNKAQINTIVVSEAIEIPIDYRMYAAAGGQWRVYDMVVEGVSLVANYRSQFARILDSDPFEVLIKQLEEKISSSS